MSERGTRAVAGWGAAKDPRLFRFAAVALAVLTLLWIRWSGVGAGLWSDLEVYVQGGRAIAGGASLYESRAGVLPFTYSPFAAVLFTPLHLLSSIVARWVFTLGAVACYLVVVGVCGRRLRLSGMHLALVAMAGMALEPFVRTILLGQINLYLMAAVVVDCLVIRSTRRRWLVGRGWLVGLAAGVKIVPGVFVLFFVIQRDWRSAMRAACGFLLTVVCGAVVAPQDSKGYWSGGVFGISHFGPAAVVDGKNQSLVGQLVRISHDPSTLTVTIIVLAAAGLALAIAAAHRQLRIGDDVAALSAIALGGLLASPLSWTHHWVWSVPAILVLVSRREWATALLFGSVFAAGPEFGVTVAPTQTSLTLLQQIACASYVLAGLGLLAIWVSGPGSGRLVSSSTIGRGPTSAQTAMPRSRRHSMAPGLMRRLRKGPPFNAARSRRRDPAQRRTHPAYGWNDQRSRLSTSASIAGRERYGGCPPGSSTAYNDPALRRPPGPLGTDHPIFGAKDVGGLRMGHRSIGDRSVHSEY